VPPETLNELFGISAIPPNSHSSSFHLTLQDGQEAARALQAKVDNLRAGRCTFPPLVVVVGGSGSQTERHFTTILADDRSKIDQSYVEFLCTIHKQIQNKLQR
jgi:hypothetical protein